MEAARRDGSGERANERTGREEERGGEGNGGSEGGEKGFLGLLLTASSSSSFN